MCVCKYIAAYLKGDAVRIWISTEITFLTLFQLGRDNFYHRNSISRDKT